MNIKKPRTNELCFTLVSSHGPALLQRQIAVASRVVSVAARHLTSTTSGYYVTRSVTCLRLRHDGYQVSSSARARFSYHHKRKLCLI
jgi:predicted HD phosphohydrolase